MALIILISAASLATGPIRESSAQADAPSWSYTFSPHSDGHSNATLLQNGKVLVVGSPSELYDPETGTWSFTGSLNVPRADYTTTLLGNGKVLVAGGANGCCQPSYLSNTAELYDPAIGEWSLTGNLNVPRNYHTATLLSNGKVLIVGGFEAAFSATAELYDPGTGKWSLTGNLSEIRVAHSATLLKDGKVLVAGGCGDEDCFDILGSAEVYDPNTETWSITGFLNTPRSSHTLTTLPNGNVLLSGGQGRIFPFTLNTAELYNPATGQWSFTGSLLNRRWQATFTLLLSGQVLVLGGQFSYDSANPGHTEVFNSAELYDPATGKWNTAASMNTARYGHTATLLKNGKVLVVGGSTGTELYDPEMLNPAPTAPRIIMASTSGKKLFITGENFDDGAVILLNGEEQKSKNDEQNPQTILIGKKAGKKIRPGDRIQVRNPDAALSEEFIFTGS